MNETCFSPIWPRATYRRASRAASIVFLLAGLLLAVVTARAQDADDQYLVLYNQIMQGDALVQQGQTAPALTKYKGAQAALENFKVENPSWNPKLVDFRLTYLAARIAGLTGKTAGAAEGAAAAGGASAMMPQQVKVLEAGGEPRTQLRLHVKPGDKQSLKFVMTLATTTKIASMPEMPITMPSITFVANTEVKGVAPDGTITYEAEITDATMADDPNLNPMIAATLKPALAGMKGQKGSGTVSNRGLDGNVKMQATAGGNAAANQFAQQMKQLFENLAPQLPGEAVGPGAKWEYATKIQSQGAKVDQTASYELVSVEGDTVNIKATSTETGGNQKVENPAMPGVKLDLQKLSGKTTGTVKQNLTHLAPDELNLEIHTESSMVVNAAGQKQNISSKNTIKLQMTSQ